MLTAMNLLLAIVLIGVSLRMATNPHMVPASMITMVFGAANFVGFLIGIGYF